MALKEQLTEDMKQAMKAKEAGKLRLSVIRMVRSAVRQIEIDEKKELTDAEVQEVVAKEIKMRRDSLAEFSKGGRQDLVEQMEAEISVLLPYLPAQLEEGEIRALVAEAIAQTGATSLKEIGKVMAALMPKVKGKADGKLVNAFVREALN